ncbi:beta strand repeat-containing protein [Rickettsia gravesii]|uniref:beta strand repeat-containing protein n=1 Tax=Rickettsia gravesii TaxID=354585 RepID=UPI000376B0C1|nr:hypothetical protein [Rickettsia gravesii]
MDTGAGGLVQFTQNSLVRFQQDVISDIDFNGTAAQVTIADGKNVGGATGGNIDNKLGGGANILNFVGNSTVIGNVGAINPVNILNVQDNNAGTINLAAGGNLAAVTSSGGVNGIVNVLGAGMLGPVTGIAALNLNGAGNVVIVGASSATTLTINNAGVVATAAGGFTSNAAVRAGQLTTNGNVDFTNGGVLEFLGANPAGYLLNSQIKNGNTETLNVYTTGTTLTATDLSIGTVNTINIEQGNAVAAFTIDVSNKALTLGSAINLNNTKFVFGLTTSKNQQVTFMNSVDGFAGGGGSVNLSSISSTIPNNNVLTLQGNLGNETLGTKANLLAVINVSGNVGVIGTNAKLGTNGFDVSNTAVLNIVAGRVFADASLTSAKIAKINIGEVNAGPAVYALDALNSDFPLDAPGVTFVNPASVLKLMTIVASGKNSTIELTGNIEPVVPNTGVVEINARNANTKLTIDGTANKYAIGTKANPVSKV